MLCLTRKTDYALIALGHMAGRQADVASARDIAAAHDLPPALLMKILKRLQKHGILRSTRGATGGYRVAADLDSVSLYELIRILEGKVEPGCEHDIDSPRRSSVQAPMQALQFKLMQFLKDVTLADLVMPGRRIDVPAESFGFRRRNHQLVPVEI